MEQEKANRVLPRDHTGHGKHPLPKTQEMTLHINTPKRCPFHYRGLEYKSRKSRNTWHNRNICPWNTEWSREKANIVLQRECTSHSKHPLPTTQEKTTHGHPQMANTELRLIIFFGVKDRKALYSQQKQDWELTVAQIISSLFQNSESRGNH